jgi:methyl-accepting chemotaxis protein
VVGGSGTQEGELIIAKNSEHVGEKLLAERDAEGKPYIVEAIAAAMASPAGEAALLEYEDPNGKGTQFTGVAYFEPWDWVIMANAPASDFRVAEEQVQSALARMVVIVLVMGLVIALAFSLAAYVASSRLLRPLENVLANLTGLASGKGDLTVRLPVTSQDEVGAIATSLNRFIEFLQKIMRVAASNAVSVHAATTALDAFSGEMAADSTALSGKSASTSAAIREVSANVRNVAAAVEEVSATTQIVAAASEQVTANLNNVGAAVEEVSANMATVSSASEEMDDAVNQVASAIEELSSSLSDVSGRSARSVAVATAAGTKAGATTETVNRLGAAAREIGSVVEMISGIAAQTNLLALNATIEAASAGEAGKGFAVVASEVKELAKRTTLATGDIQQKVEEMQENTAQSVAAIGEIVGIIREMSELSVSIADAVSEQTATTGEVARSVSGTARNVMAVSQSIREASAATNEVSRNVQEAIKGAIEIAHSISEIATGTNDIARNAAGAAGSIMQTEQNVAEMDRLVIAARTRAVGVADAAGALGDMAAELDSAISNFKSGEKRFDLGKVKVAHLLWRGKLRALLDGVLTMKPSEVPSHLECELGKWYESQAGTAMSSHPAFAEVGHLHEKVHRLACEVVQSFEKGDRVAANNIFDAFEPARIELFAALDRLYAE